jgi:hypothetical protein
MEFIGDHDRLARACEAVEQRLAALRERQVRAGSGAEAALAAYARGPSAPAPLRAVQRRVDAGELSWEQVVFGSGGDPEVRAVRALLDRSLL